MSQQFTCPHCGDHQTQRVSVIYEAGTQLTGSHFVGVDSNFDLAVGSGKSITRSSLALRLAPPMPPKKKRLGAIPITIIIAVAALIGGDMGDKVKDEHNNNKAGQYIVYGLLIGAVVAVALAWVVSTAGNSKYRKASQLYNSRVRQWNGEFFCHRCGQTFFPNTGQQQSLDWPS